MTDAEVKNNSEETVNVEQNQDDQALKKCLIELEEWENRFLRMSADFDNYKKRTEKEKILWMQTAQSAVLYDVISIVDDFDRAFAQQQAGMGIEGFELIYKSLQKMLEKYQIQEITDMTNFNPLLHEAVMQVDDPSRPSGSIVQILQKGYLFKGEILRPAKVSVAK